MLRAFLLGSLSRGQKHDLERRPKHAGPRTTSKKTRDSLSLVLSDKKYLWSKNIVDRTRDKAGGWLPA